MQLVWTERSHPITGGFVLSVLFHVFLFVFALVVVPLFRLEIDETPPGIEATIVSDINAAPKVDKQGKPEDQPKPPTPPAPEVKKPEPPKPAPPVTPPPQSATPPQAAEQQAVAVPDETKKADQPKKEEKKPEEKKPPAKKPDEVKKQKQQDQDFNKLLANLAKEQPAPDTQEKTKPKAQPAPAKPTTGQLAPNTTDGPPMTANENSLIAAQLVPCWNFDSGVANPENYSDITVRISVREDGTITAAELVDTGRLGDPTYRSVADSALRTVQNPQCNVLKLPQGKYWPQMDIVFDLAKAINGGY